MTGLGASFFGVPGFRAHGFSLRVPGFSPRARGNRLFSGRALQPPVRAPGGGSPGDKALPGMGEHWVAGGRE